MNWTNIFHELGTLMTYRELAEKVGLNSASQAHKIAHGVQKSVSYEVGKAALDLLKARQTLAKRVAKQ